MVPPELRIKRTKTVMAKAPEGSAWCASCQSWRDVEDFGNKATQCRPCASGAQHAAMVAKIYGLTGNSYDELLEAQGGRCAICRAKPKSKRLAVDHDHKTGAVRGLLCKRCNHDLMGAAWDSLAMANALVNYINTPPASGVWVPPENITSGAVRPVAASAPEPAPFATRAGSASEHPQSSSAGDDFTPSDVAAGILAGLAPDVPTAQALWAALDKHLKRVDPAPF